MEKYIPPQRRRKDIRITTPTSTIAKSRPSKKKYESIEDKIDFYTRPQYENDFYEYEISDWNSYMEDSFYPKYSTVRSSFIPYTVIYNEKYWVLGSFQDFPNEILADFGGKCGINIGNRKYPDYQKAYGCAVLELHEETKGLLDRIVMSSLANNPPEIYVGVNHEFKTKVWFVQVFISPESASYFVQNFAQSPSVVNERFGPVNLYLYRDILYHSGIKTTHNLTDFLNYIKNKR